MCVIIYKPAGVELPATDIMEKAHKANPHGCGLVSPSVKYKGMQFTTFMKRYSQCKKEEPLLIHFRLATHGSIRRANSHPFYDKGTDTYFMHNGVLHEVETHNDRTDSECAFRSMIVPKIKLYGLHDWRFSKFIYGMIGASKFAFMQCDRVHIFGDFIPLGRCYYSNIRFMGSPFFKSMNKS